MTLPHLVSRSTRNYQRRKWEQNQQTSRPYLNLLESDHTSKGPNPKKRLKIPLNPKSFTAKQKVAPKNSTICTRYESIGTICTNRSSATPVATGTIARDIFRFTWNVTSNNVTTIASTVRKHSKRTMTLTCTFVRFTLQAGSSSAARAAWSLGGKQFYRITS
uniref:(northern house mosquito) hypothetical protein n=1 Tax=Culex pipiens TaxID=7175 RepID=A0A8D8BQM8_CULPI